MSTLPCCFAPRSRARLALLLGTLLPGCYAGLPDDLEAEPAFAAEFPLVAAPDTASFPSTVTIPLGLGFPPLDLEVGDFDGDGALDLLVIGTDNADVATSAMLLGHGDGTFDAPFDPNLGGCTAFPVVGLVTEDSLSDVVVPGCSNNVAVFAGSATGNLTLWPAGPETNYPNFINVVVADVDSDADNDLVLITPLFGGTTRINVEFGAEGRGFWSNATTSLFDVDGFTPTEMAMGRLDGDDFLDLVLAEREQDVTRVLGDRSGQFVLPMGLGVDVPPWSVDMGDLDGDGLDEVVVASYSDTSLQVLFPDGTGELIAAAPVDLPNFAPYDTTLADLDGDGDLDVAMVDDGRRRVRWLANDGLGSLGAPQTFNLPTPAVRVHAGDFDGDGRNDLVTATFADDSVTLLLSTGP